MRVSMEGLRSALHLPDDVVFAAAGTERHFSHLPGEPAADTLVLTVDLPDAPADAAEALGEYEHSGHRDPVEFKRFRYYRADGTEIKPEES
jgi:hypothetical protein